MAPKAAEELLYREREVILGRVGDLRGVTGAARFSSDFGSQALQKSAIAYDVYMREGTGGSLRCEWFWGVCVTASNSVLSSFLPYYDT
jgi:hypothetical protein